MLDIGKRNRQRRRTAEPDIIVHFKVARFNINMAVDSEKGHLITPNGATGGSFDPCCDRA